MKFLKEHALYIFVLVVALLSATVLYGMYRSKAECKLRGGISVRATPRTWRAGAVWTSPVMWTCCCGW